VRPSDKCGDHECRAAEPSLKDVFIWRCYSPTRRLRLNHFDSRLHSPDAAPKLTVTLAETEPCDDLLAAIARRIGDGTFFRFFGWVFLCQRSCRCRLRRSD
jgi:hypothetical protein